MPKLKTHKGLHKRVKLSARGKVVHKRSCAGHLMSGKSGRRRQRLRRKLAMTGALARKAALALGPR